MMTTTATGSLLDGRYRLGRVLGRGGMATVYAATDTKLRRPVAVKLFHPGTDENTMARLETEAQLLGGLSHPGLLRVFDVVLGPERSYIVLQLIDGGTLRTALNGGRLRPAVVGRLGARIAETLRYIHSRQIVHRDIKPSNVLMDASGVGYLADFGIATLIGSARLTRTGNCMGTAAYLAPEQVRGAAPGPAIDIYALGLVLLECLTGRPEYTGTEAEAALARLHRQPRVPSWVPPGLSEALVAMTAREPADRPDAAGCVALFEAYLARPNRAPEPRTLVDIETVTEVVAMVPAPRRLRALHALAGGVVLAAVAAGAVWATTAETGSPVGPAPARQEPAPQVAEVVPQTAAGQVENNQRPAEQRQAPPAKAPGQGKGKEKDGHKSGHEG